MALHFETYPHDMTGSFNAYGQLIDKGVLMAIYHFTGNSTDAEIDETVHGWLIKHGIAHDESIKIKKELKKNRDSLIRVHIYPCFR